MAIKDNEEEELRSVAVQNARSILLARRRAEEALRKQSEWLRVTLSSIGDAVISTDADSRITFMNVVAESLTGWPQGEALGRPLQDVFHIVNERSRTRVANPALRVLSEGNIAGLANHTILISRDGSEWPIDDSAAPIRNDQGEVAGVVLVFRDITERKREEAAEAERTRLVAVRADVSTALASGQATPAALQQCCEALVRHLDVAFAGIWTINDADKVLESQAHAGLNTHLNGPASRVPLGEFNIGRIASTREPYLTNAVPDDPNVSNREWATLEGMTAFAGYPLMVEDRVVGVVAMFAVRALTEGVLTELAPLADAIAQYIDRRQAAESFRQKAEFHRVTLASIGDAVLTTDANGDVTYLNAVAQTLTGWKYQDARGKPLTMVFNIINQETRQRVENPVERVLRESKVVGLTNHTILIGEDGAERPIDDSAAPIQDDDGRVVGVVLVFHDITDRRRSEEALKIADRRKNEFLAMLAHELRNPLAPIRNALEIVRLTRGNEEAVQSVFEIIERQIGQMVRLVDDLLDVNRISQGKIELRRERVELSSVIHQAVETCRPTLESARHELTVMLPAQAVYLYADPMRLAQAFSNLLNNSCKYTDAGGQISVTAEVQGSDVLVVVKDTGIGIPADMLRNVFDIFAQVDRSLERSRGGLGIGLTLVKELVEMHGGRVEARSEGPGKGSEVIVHLPFSEQLAEQIAEKPKCDDQEAKLPLARRILVVDDNQDSAESLVILLRTAGHEVHTASDGLEAVDLAVALCPDVVLLDIGLPKLNGYEAARRIREQLRSRQPMLLVALTGWGQEEDRRRSTAAGFDHHLTKPVEFSTLKKLIGSIGHPPQ